MARQTAQDTVIEGPSKKARELAERANLRALESQLAKASDATMQAFLHNNLDAIDVFHVRNKNKTLSGHLDAALAALAGEDKDKAAETRTYLHRVAARFIAKSGLAFNEIDTSGLKIRAIAPESIQKDWDKRAANRKEAFGRLRGAASALATGIAQTATFPVYALTHSPISSMQRLGSIAANLSYRPLKDTYYGVMRMRGLGVLPSTAILGGVAAATITAMTIPFDAAPYAPEFTRGQLSQSDFRDACSPAVLESTRLTAAFAISVNANTPAMRMHYISAMEAVKYGVSPVAVYAVSAKETMNFRDVVANNSSASGPYQSIVETKLQWLSDYAQDTPYYKEAKARLKSGGQYERRAQDETFVLSIDTTVTDFRKNREGVLEDFRNRKIPLPRYTAMSAADEPVFSGQLMAAELAAKAPYLSAENLEGKSADEIVSGIGRYYRTHLLGEAGSNFLNYLLTEAPDTKMDDTAALKKAYLAYAPNAGAKKAAYYADYYKTVVSKNGGVFKKGAGITAQQFAGQITTFVEKWSGPIVNQAMQELNQGDTPFIMCLTDKGKAVIAAVVPEKTNYAQLSFMRVSGLVNAHMPETLRATYGEKLDSGWRSINNLLSVSSETPRAEAINTTIEEIILEGEQGLKTSIRPKSRPKTLGM